MESEPLTDPSFSHGFPRAEKAGAKEGSEKEDAEEALFNAQDLMGLRLGLVQPDCCCHVRQKMECVLHTTEIYFLLRCQNRVGWQAVSLPCSLWDSS